MRVAMIAPIAWRTPPRAYGPWELVTSLLTEALAKRGVDVTLFATKDSVTSANHESIVPAPYNDDASIDAKVWEYRHLANVFSQADRFDIIHNQADFPAHAFAALTDTPVVTTVHGLSSTRILPMYEHFDELVHLVAISEADRHPSLRYAATIHHGIQVEDFPFEPHGTNDLLFFGRIHKDKGAVEAIVAAQESKRHLNIYGIIQDEEYFRSEVAPLCDTPRATFHGPVGGQQRLSALGQARALLHLINFGEPFGLSVIEAMACGTPVIANARGSMPEIIEHGVNGFLVHDHSEAVAAIDAAGSLDRSLVRKSIARRFSAKRMADEYIELYRSILKS